MFSPFVFAASGIVVDLCFCFSERNADIKVNVRIFNDRAPLLEKSVERAGRVLKAEIKLRTDVIHISAFRAPFIDIGAVFVEDLVYDAGRTYAEQRLSLDCDADANSLRAALSKLSAVVG